MDSRYSLSSITLEDFNQLLDEYPKVVQPKLAQLDQSRYETIPAALAEQRNTYNIAIKNPAASTPAKPPAMTKADVVNLVDWKLSHGTFRPSLRKLIESNSERDIINQTTATFLFFHPPLRHRISDGLNALTELKGVGPATATLLFSVWQPDSAPFFSDELFRWTHWESKPGLGWDRIIKYTRKEYLEMFDKVTELRDRLDVRAVDVERVAYVIGRRALGKSAESETKADTTAQRGTKKRKAEPEARNDAGAPKKAATKAKAVGKAAKKKPEPTKGTRSSTRLNANKQAAQFKYCL